MLLLLLCNSTCDFSQFQTVYFHWNCVCQQALEQLVENQLGFCHAGWLFEASLLYCIVCGSNDSQFTHTSQIIWESLPLLEKNVLILHHLVFCHILPKLATLHLLMISKFFLPTIQPVNF